MLYITYIEPLYESKDPHVLYKSSGHILLDVFSAFIFAFLLDAKVVYHKSWGLSRIISSKSFENYCDKPPNKYNYEITIDTYEEWAGISFDQYSSIKQKILKVSKQYKNVLVKFTNVCKIHIQTLYTWYKLNYVSNNIYHENILPLLHNLYYFDNNATLIDTFSIHIRRGDLHTRMIEEGFTYQYYENIINVINKYLNIKINIYCEDSNYDDIINLNKLKNTHVDIGGLNDFSRQFNELCRSKYLILSPSCFSIYTAYLSKGIVLCDVKTEATRPNVFKNLNTIPDVLFFSEEKTIETIIRSFKSEDNN